jgi:glutathione S-transferase
MSALTLYIGNKNYSSWSLRAWLALKQVGAPFTEVVIPLDGPGRTTTAILAHSPSGKVPALHHGDVVVWDSLAIVEYLAESFPAAKLWPSDRAARAVARAASAEMHAGFPNLRSQMPMNVRRAPFEAKRSAELDADVARVVALWDDCRRRFGARGPFLFGELSAADAMFAPVATRFRTYGVPLPEGARAYVAAVYALPAMNEWIAAARSETWVNDAYDHVGR